MQDELGEWRAGARRGFVLETEAAVVKLRVAFGVLVGGSLVSGGLGIAKVGVGGGRGTGVGVRMRFALHVGVGEEIGFALRVDGGVSRTLAL